MLQRHYAFDWADKMFEAKWERWNVYAIYENKDEVWDLEVYIDWDFELLTSSIWEATSFCNWYESAMQNEVPNKQLF